MQSLITERLLGVEIECVIPIVGRGENLDVQNLLAEVLSNQGIRAAARQYSHAPVPSGCKLAVEHDSSLRDESRYAGLRWSKIEVKTTPMTYRQLEQVLPAALDIINYFGARVNASCGLHVHHHLPEVHERPQVVKSLQHLWWRMHRVMFGLVAPSRRSNTYCSAPAQHDALQYDECTTYAKVARAASNASRYSALNMTNLANQRCTVEWRLHQGTTDWKKISAWILATQRWVEHAVTRNCHYRAEPLPSTRESLNSLLVTTGLKSNSRIYAQVDKDLRVVGKYLLRRWKEFNLPRHVKSNRKATTVTVAA